MFSPKTGSEAACPHRLGPAVGAERAPDGGPSVAPTRVQALLGGAGSASPMMVRPQMKYRTCNQAIGGPRITT
jgi:hypothetical protein